MINHNKQLSIKLFYSHLQHMNDTHPHNHHFMCKMPSPVFSPLPH